jgi:hypothetical protein
MIYRASARLKVNDNIFNFAAHAARHGKSLSNQLESVNEWGQPAFSRYRVPVFDVS